jgi:LmbE family N-acetylglucosaminyl deacetylase
MSLIPWYHPAPQPLLVVAPHADDEVIGCGGLLAAHSRLGGESTVLYLTGSEERRGQEAQAARSQLDVKHAVELNLPEGRVRSTEQSRNSVLELLLKLKPRTIMLPSTGDPHPDHQMAHTLFSEALSALEGSDAEILFYETFTPLSDANAWLNITSTARQKWEALACYRSQQERYGIVEIAQHLNAFRGLTTMRRHIHYAEAFRRLTVAEYQLSLEARRPGRRVNGEDGEAPRPLH